MDMVEAEKFQAITRREKGAAAIGSIAGGIGGFVTYSIMEQPAASVDNQVANLQYQVNGTGQLLIDLYGASPRTHAVVSQFIIQDIGHKEEKIQTLIDHQPPHVSGAIEASLIIGGAGLGGLALAALTCTARYAMHRRIRRMANTGVKKIESFLSEDAH